MPKQVKTEADREHKREYDRQWYRKHSAQILARNAEQKRKIHQWYEEHKASLACQRCPENHPATLIFHHRDPNEKESSISQAMHDGWSIERILKEMQKCDILCVNCHRRLHDSLEHNNLQQV